MNEQDDIQPESLVELLLFAPLLKYLDNEMYFRCLSRFIYIDSVSKAFSTVYSGVF